MPCTTPPLIWPSTSIGLTIVPQSSATDRAAFHPGCGRVDKLWAVGIVPGGLGHFDRRRRRSTRWCVACQDVAQLAGVVDKLKPPWRERVRVKHVLREQRVGQGLAERIDRH